MSGFVVFIISQSEITDEEAKKNLISSLDKMSSAELKVFYDFLKLQSSGAEVSNDLEKNAENVAIKYKIDL